MDAAARGVSGEACGAALRTMTLAEVARHASPGDLWLAIDGFVYDVSTFAALHPGSAGVLERAGGKDVTAEFFSLHRAEVLDKYAKLLVGRLDSTPADRAATRDPAALSKVPFAEWDSPFFTPSHRRFQRAVREFVVREIQPLVDELEKKDALPSDALMRKMGEFGLIAGSLGPGKHLAQWGPKLLPGGVKPEDFDYFHEAILSYEIKRLGSWGVVDGLAGATVIGLPPVMNFGSKELRERIVPEVLSGEKRICLAITDPYAGSDVANTTCTAVMSADGSHFVVNGVKKVRAMRHCLAKRQAI